MGIYNKQIHWDQFRLRLLVTNTCNESCSFCLNDFQLKQSSYFLDSVLGTRVIRDYCNLVTDLGLEHPPIIHISGGEPGLYSHLKVLLKAASPESIISINTNGLLHSHRDWDFVRQRINCVVYHVTPALLWTRGQTDHQTWASWFNWWLDDLEKFRHGYNQKFQLVWFYKSNYFNFGVSRSAHILRMEEAIRVLMDRGKRVKIFKDFLASPEETELFRSWFAGMKEKYPDLQTRFSGVQENRGVGCRWCQKNCVTLKAHWVFADSTGGPCPQLPKKIKHTWDDIKSSYLFHKVK